MATLYVCDDESGRQDVGQCYSVAGCWSVSEAQPRNALDRTKDKLIEVMPDIFWVRNHWKVRVKKEATNIRMTQITIEDSVNLISIWKKPNPRLNIESYSSAKIPIVPEFNFISHF